MVNRNRRKADVYGETRASEENILGFYFKEINKIPVLSKEEEDEMARLAVQGNELARKKLLNANLRFVVMVAKKYQGKGLPFQDLISEGNIGLMKALDHFDTEKGYRFISYAVWWIRQSITKALGDKGKMIRLPLNQINKLSQHKEKLQQLQNERSGKSCKKIWETTSLVNIGRDTISLDEPFGDYDGDLSLKDILEDDRYDTPEEYAIKSVLRDEVDILLNSLESRNAEILCRRFGLKNSDVLTLAEMGEKQHLSRERIRQLEARAIRELQSSPRSANLQSYTAG